MYFYFLELGGVHEIIGGREERWRLPSITESNRNSVSFETSLVDCMATLTRYSAVICRWSWPAGDLDCDGR